MAYAYTLLYSTYVSAVYLKYFLTIMFGKYLIDCCLCGNYLGSHCFSLKTVCKLCLTEYVWSVPNCKGTALYYSSVSGALDTKYFFGVGGLVKRQIKSKLVV